MSSMKLWGGRFAEGPSEIFEQFSNSLHFDRRLIEADIRDTFGVLGKFVVGFPLIYHWCAGIRCACAVCVCCVLCAVCVCVCVRVLCAVCGSRY